MVFGEWMASALKATAVGKRFESALKVTLGVRKWLESALKVRLVF